VIKKKRKGHLTQKNQRSRKNQTMLKKKLLSGCTPQPPHPPLSHKKSIETQKLTKKSNKTKTNNSPNNIERNNIHTYQSITCPNNSHHIPTENPSHQENIVSIECGFLV
jgi:hypothetical protein